MTNTSRHAPLFPIFLKLTGRRVLLVGAGRVAASKLSSLLDAGADVRVVAPEVSAEIAALPVTIVRRRFEASDLDGVWLVVSAAPHGVNREVAAAADVRGIFVNAVDDVESASAYLGAVVKRAGVTLAIGTSGVAPALAGLLREGLDSLLPPDLDLWVACATEERRKWLAAGVPMEQRRPLLLDALVRLRAARYGGQVPDAAREGGQAGESTGREHS